MTPIRRFRPLVLSALLALATPAAAHGGHIHEGQSFWSMWHFSPEIILGLLVAGWFYARGIGGGDAKRWRHVAFFGGLVALGLALLSPIEPLADHVFAVHQVEHMLLRTIGPMLLLLSAPQAALMRGMPAGFRRAVAGPVVTNAGVRRVFGALSQPAMATMLFIGISYFWMWPRWHDIAILNEPIHYTWHVTLLVSGLFFFSVIFDPRGSPAGPRLGTRLAMFFVAAMGNILLGAFLSFKTVPLYAAYDVMGRFFGIDALTDEQIGGLTMWIPGCMMVAISALLILHKWGVEEERSDARRVRMGTHDAHHEAQVAGRGRANRALAIGLGSFVLAVLLIALTTSIFYEHELTPAAEARHAALHHDPAG